MPGLTLGFPRDETSRGTKKFPCLAVPGQDQQQKSRDKLLCHRASWDKITTSLAIFQGVLNQNRLFENRKGHSKTGKGHS